MVTILREADQRPIAEVARKHGKRPNDLRLAQGVGHVGPADVKRMPQLEHENGRLKKMVADRDLEIDVLKGPGYALRAPATSAWHQA
jgi:putative transposase